MIRTARNARTAAPEMRQEGLKRFERSVKAQTPLRSMRVLRTHTCVVAWVYPAPKTTPRLAFRSEARSIQNPRMAVRKMADSRMMRWFRAPGKSCTDFGGMKSNARRKR